VIVYVDTWEKVSGTFSRGQLAARGSTRDHGACISERSRSAQPLGWGLVMRSRLVLAVYGAAALWLAAFVADLVYLLLPFGIGLLSTLFASLVALGVFLWLVHRLVWRPLRHQTVGRWGFAAVLALAIATVTLDGGWTHYLIPFPPTDQDNCTFGPIGADEFQALERETAAKFDPDWVALYRDPDAKEKLERQMTAVLPKEATEAEMVAHIHALARSIGAEFSHGGDYRPPNPAYENPTVAYNYRFDLNNTSTLRTVLFRWARILFVMAKPQPDSGSVRLDHVAIVMPSIEQSSPLPPDRALCPQLPQEPGGP
jgi:hypothetical protein